MIENDELKIYRGDDYIINDKIIIHQPTLNEICDFGDNKYFSVVHIITSIPVDYILDLEEKNIKYENISDYEMFLYLYKSINKEESYLLFKDLDFSKFEICTNIQNNQVILYDKENDIVIDKYIYQVIVDYLRKSHGLHRNNVICGNLAMREVLLEEAEVRRHRKNDNKSILKPLISSMINTKEFKYGHNEIWNMKINAFIDSISRISLIKNYEQTMQGLYSGCLDYKHINKTNLNWMKELN